MGGDTSPEQQYSLRWNDFHASILSSFRHLKDEEDFVDVTLACDGCSFTAHKVVLSACSPYFRRLLKANPCQHPIVILRDVQQKDMESLLRWESTFIAKKYKFIQTESNFYLASTFYRWMKKYRGVIGWPPRRQILCLRIFGLKFERSLTAEFISIIKLPFK